MTIFLPVAGISVNLFSLMGAGALVGFLSGVFGVGGGFLLTPLLIMMGIRPMVAAASDANQIVAASTSGAFAHYKEGNVDVKMGMFIFAGGIIGSAIGTFVIKALRQTGNVDVTIRICYVLLLTVVGTSMLIESLTRNIGEEEMLHDKTWLDRVLLKLPFPTQFKASGVTTSALNPLLLGTLVGILAAIMGVGGGFLLIPAMTFLLRMPMRVVVGTSLFQMLFTSSATTIMQAAVNHNVDILLAISLLIGSSVGAQLGARVGRRLSGQQLKILLAILVLAISLKMFIDLLIRPARFLVERGGH